MKLLREPLFHFVLLGSAIATLYHVASHLLESAEKRQIEIGAAEIEFIANTWEKRWLRPPTEEQLRGAVDARVREEILYREAIVLGLDANDAIVRRRMVQKMELLSEDLALLADPSDQELRSWFQEHQEDYRLAPRLSFSHVYLNVNERGASVEVDAQRILEELRAMRPVPETAPGLGDPFLLGRDHELRSRDEVSREFGERFALALFELESGWQGPIASGFGLHLVYVGERVDGRLPEFAEVRERLVMDFDRARRDRTQEALYEAMRQRYEVSIDEATLQGRAVGSP